MPQGIRNFLCFNCTI